MLCGDTFDRLGPPVFVLEKWLQDGESLPIFESKN